MNRRGFFGLAVGAAAAAAEPQRWSDALMAELKPTPAHAAVELGIAAPAEAAGGFLVPPNYLDEIVGLMKSGAISLNAARADLGLAELAR